MEVQCISLGTVTFAGLQSVSNYKTHLAPQHLNSYNPKPWLEGILQSLRDTTVKDAGSGSKNKMFYSAKFRMLLISLKQTEFF